MFLKLLPIISCIAVFLLEPANASKEPKIRILVFEAKNLYFKADKEKLLTLKGFDSTRKNTIAIKVQLEKGRIKYSLGHDLSNWYYLSKNRQIIIRSRDPRGIWLGNRRFSGDLRIVNKGTILRVVNHLPLEKYLKSVVGGEMPKSWPIEALKAQAVASRTYALNKLKRKNKLDYDLKSGTSNQVYLGIEAETNSTRRAVDSTRSIVLAYKGSLIDAVFHTCSGKQTESSVSVWNKDKPYLKSVNDFDQDVVACKWEKIIRQKELKEIFSKIGGVNVIRVLSRSESDRAKRIKVYGPRGVILFTGKEARELFRLRSTLVSFQMMPNVANNQKNIKLKYYSLPKLEESEESSNFSDNTIYILDGSTPLPSIPEDDFLLIKGIGSGHGVGMSQWGAKYMAENGNNYRSILKHFYKGIRILSYSPY